MVGNSYQRSTSGCGLLSSLQMTICALIAVIGLWLQHDGK
jgi:hypothetical protein